MDNDRLFVEACCIGDGYLRCCSSKPGSKSYSFSMRHGIKQLDYLVYKSSRINAYLGKSNQVKLIDNNGYPGCEWRIGCNEVLRPIYEQLYPNGKKTITKEMLSNHGIETLAVLWMDDGSFTIRRRKTETGYTNGARIGYLSTYTDTYEGSLLVAEWVKSLCGASPLVTPHKSKFRIAFNAHDLCKLCPVIESYVVPSMKYKVDLRYVNKKHVVTNPTMFYKASG